MNLRQQHPRFFVLMGGTALLLGAGVWWTLRAGDAAGIAERQLAGKRQEWRMLAEGEAAATEAASAALLARKTAVAQRRSTLVAKWQGAEMQAVTPPPDRAAAFFELAAMIESLRKKAEAAGVSLQTDEYFGFSSHRQTGPEERLITTVHRQQMIVQKLLETLFEAGPSGLLAVQRQRPEAERVARAQTGTAADFFTVDPRWSLRRDPALMTQAYRVTFTGETPVLRSFLRRLAVLELPLIVRLVEAEPLAEPAAGVKPGSGGWQTVPPHGASNPLFGARQSKFTVTLEHAVMNATAEEGER
jgi:hypothetical protein